MGEGERFHIVRALGADAAGFIAHDTSHAAHPVVLERVTRSATAADERARLLGRARALLGFEHPKVVPLRDVLERDGEVLIASEFVDGEWLSALLGLDPRPPLEVSVRLVLDVLEGVAALHALLDAAGQPAGFVHGALSPECILVAEDGVAEIARPCGSAHPKPDRFVAPELRRGEVPKDSSADVYSVGAILREILSLAPPGDPWVERLTDIAWRACSVEPEHRWPSAAAMATALRRVAGARLASPGEVSTFMREHFGARLHARRAALDLLDPPPPPSSAPLSVRDLDVIDEEHAPSSAPLSVRPSDPLPDGPSSAPILLDDEKTPALGKAIARVALVKRAAARAPAAGPPVSDRDPEAPPKGMTAIAPPMHTVEAPAVARKKPSLPPPDLAGDAPTPAKNPSLPPPTILVEPALPKKASLPPPTIVPDESPKKPSLPPPDILPDVAYPGAAQAADGSLDTYRRRQPTFHIVEPPPRSRGTQVLVIALALAATFAVGWWFGRERGPTNEGASVETVPAPVEVTSAPPAPTPAATVIPAATATATATAIPAPSVAAIAPAPRPTTVVVAAPAPRPVPTPVAATTTAVPTVTSAPTAKPAPTSTYVPSEL